MCFAHFAAKHWVNYYLNSCSGRFDGQNKHFRIQKLKTRLIALLERLKPLLIRESDGSAAAHDAGRDGAGFDIARAQGQIGIAAIGRELPLAERALLSARRCEWRGDRAARTPH